MSSCAHSDTRYLDRFCRSCGAALLDRAMPSSACAGCGSTRGTSADHYCVDCGAQHPPLPTGAPLADFSKTRAYWVQPARCSAKDDRNFVCVRSGDHVNPHLFDP